jgi:phosphoglycerate dehydrogenase-like enzyme
MMRVAFLMDPLRMRFAFGAAERAALGELFEPDDEPAASAAQFDDPAGIDAILMGWGASDLTAADLARMPKLKAVVHFGGGFGGEAIAAERGIFTANAKTVNAVPVADFTLAMITLAAKDVFWAERQYRAEQRFLDREIEYGDTGLGGRTVGIVGASTIGELVIRGLVGHGHDVAVYDPFLTPERAAELGVQVETDLARLASQSRIFSLHAPDITTTRGMVSAAVLAALPDGATLINTARGALVDQDALVRELASGRIRAALDVTEPDPLPAGHPLFALPNVYLTPHLAGAMGTEIRDLGRASVAALLRHAGALV